MKFFLIFLIKCEAFFHFRSFARGYTQYNLEKFTNDPLTDFLPKLKKGR
jgi:hypothetical protein